MRTRPTLDAMTDPNRLLVLLMEAYTDIAQLKRDQLPSTIPALKAVTLPSHAELRKHTGDTNGEKGPRACIVAGRSAPLDGGEGVFVWDAASTLADDDAAAIQPLGVSVGRWRKGSF